MKTVDLSMFTACIVMLFVAPANAEPSKLMQTWRIDKSAFSGQVLRGTGRATSKAVEPTQFDDDGLLIFTDNQHVLVNNKSVRDMPAGSFSVEAWVRIDKPERWGCIFGIQEDNGSYERGWSLGYNGDRFEMRCSNGDSLVNVTAATPMSIGTWHHVVGVCDTSNAQVRIYVDGKQSAVVSFAVKSVVYPETSLDTPLAIGAYKDKDEFFPLEGRIREVRLYEGVADENMIAAHVVWSPNLPDKTLAFSVRPGVRFLTPTSAEIRWDTTVAGESGVAYGTTKKLGKVVLSKNMGLSHRVTLQDLVPGKSYWYRFGLTRNGKRTFSPQFQFDGSMNYSPPDIDMVGDDDRVKLLAREQWGGYAVVDQGIDPDWAESIASATAMTVVACADGDASADQLRHRWYSKDVYGIRLSVQHPETIPDGFANLVVVEGSNLQNAMKWRSPTGCIVAVNQRPGDETLQWEEVGEGIWFGQPKSDSIPIASWGHQYGTLGNTVFSGETLGGIDNTADLEMRWIGRPGADFGIDRNPRMPAPLAIGGRLFHQGMNRMVALDAFNGAVLWSLEIPDLRRVNIPRDSSNWCADASHVYVAVNDRLWVIDAVSGKMLDALRLPSPYDHDFDWGYVATTSDLILGTATKPGSTYSEFWGGQSWYEKSDDGSTSKVCGNALVAYDKAIGELKWQYPSDAIVHSTIAVSGTHVYFVKVDDPSLKVTKTGKLPNSKIWDSASIVCLDLQTGEELWNKAAPSQPHEVLISFGICDESQYVLQTSGKGHFHFNALDASMGNQRWAKSVNWSESDHSANFQHAVLMNDRLYVQPHIINATNGDVIKSGTLGKRRGCSTPVGLGGAILFRGGSGPTSLWSLKDNKRTEITRLRQSCWLSTIPAQGMLFSPEGGGGCSCGGWMETSIGFAPRASEVTK